MSFSFTVKAATKALVKEKVASELDSVVRDQPSHSQDRPLIQSACEAYVDLLSDDDEKDIELRCNGSLSGTWVANEVTNLSGANLSVSAYFQTRA